MQRVFKLFDILGEDNFVLLYNDKRHRTVLGGTLSITLILFYIAMMINLIMEYTNNPFIINQYEVYENSNNSLKLDYDIQIYDINTSSFLSDDQFEISLIKYHNFEYLNIFNKKFEKKEKIEILKNMKKIKIDSQFYKDEETLSCIKLEIKPLFNISSHDLIVKLETPNKINEFENYNPTHTKSYFPFLWKYISYFKNIREYEDDGLIIKSYNLKNVYSRYHSYEKVDKSEFFELFFITIDNVIIQEKIKIKFLPQAAGIYCLFKLIYMVFRLINNNELNAFYYSLIKRDLNAIKMPIITTNQNKGFHQLNVNSNSEITHPKKPDDQLHTIIRIQKKNSFLSNHTVKNMLNSNLEKQNKVDTKIDINITFSEILRLYICCRPNRNVQNYFISKEKLKRMLSIDYIINKISRMEQDMKEIRIDDKLLNQSFIIQDQNSIK